MLQVLKRFFHGEKGAVTVDMMVMTSAVIGLGGSLLVSTGAEMTGLGDRVSEYLVELGDGSVLTISANDASGWSYLPFWPPKWDTRLAEMRKAFSGADAEKILEGMKKQLGKDGTVRAGRQDEYAAYQIVLEENGDSLPKGWPDMRDF